MNIPESVRKMQFKYDRNADAVYVLINDVRHHHSTEIDESRFVDYGETGVVQGIELLYVGSGVDLNGLPYQAELKELLEKNGIKTFL